MYREGIKNYIDQNYGKVKNIYNETITLFFIHMLHSAIEQVSGVIISKAPLLIVIV